MCDFHSQSQGMCWYFRTALETLSTQIETRRSGESDPESDQPPARKETIGHFGVRIWQWIYVEFIWQPGIWHHDRNHIVTTNAQTIIFCLNLARQLQTNNEQTRTQNRPTCWQLASEVDPHLHMLRAAPSRVAWDFDSPWITGPMTAHQSVAYVRHIILAPAANLCTPSAIVFLPIRAWIWRHIRRYLDGSAILLTVNGPVWPSWLKISPCVTTKIMWSEKAFR